MDEFVSQLTKIVCSGAHFSDIVRHAALTEGKVLGLRRFTTSTAYILLLY